MQYSIDFLTSIAIAIAIVLMAIANALVMILMIHMHGKEAQIFYILGTFLTSFMYTMSIASVLPPNSGR